MISIVDYNIGNLGSVKNMISKIGFESQICNSQKDIRNAQKLILPGVGSFDACMHNLKRSGLIQAIEERVLVDKIPILGICVGMQLFTHGSDEGESEGLSWLDGKCQKFKFDNVNENLKIPHMGWNSVATNNHNSLFKEMEEDARFYFAHSFHVVLSDTKEILATSKYGYEFISAIQKENIYGVQFHPEKSLKHGMKLLSNFLNIS